MKLVDKILLEYGFDSVTDEEWAQAYMSRINRERDGLLERAVNEPGFRFDLARDVVMLESMEPNKCETNSFKFVRRHLEMGKANMLPVGGYAFTKSMFPVEHWWVYDSDKGKCIEVTPVGGEFVCYAGVVRSDLQGEILRASNVFDVDFFKGGNPHSWHFR